MLQRGRQHGTQTLQLREPFRAVLPHTLKAERILRKRPCPARAVYLPDIYIVLEPARLLDRQPGKARLCQPQQRLRRISLGGDARGADHQRHQRLGRDRTAPVVEIGYAAALESGDHGVAVCGRGTRDHGDIPAAHPAHGGEPPYLGGDILKLLVGVVGADKSHAGRLAIIDALRGAKDIRLKMGDIRRREALPGPAHDRLRHRDRIASGDPDEPRGGALYNGEQPAAVLAVI